MKCYNSFVIMPKNENQLNKAIAILQILLSQTDDEHVIKTQDLSLLLYDTFGIEAEDRSVLRDLKQLRDLFDTPVEDVENAEDIQFRYGVDYDYRNSKKGWHIIERPFSQSDALFLIECINSSKSISDATAKKLKELIASQRSSFEKEELLDKESIYTIGRSRTDNNKLLRILETIDSAIKNNHKISFKYKNYRFVNGKIQKADRRQGKQFLISPYKTLMNDSNYYVLGVNERNENIIPYRLDRMEDIEETQEQREGMELFKQINLATYTKEIFNMFSGKREYVSIRFTNDLLTAIVDRFGEKEIKPYDDRHFVLNTHVLVSDQFFSWLCGFKKKAKILSPDHVQEDFKAFIEDIYQLNQ